MTYLFEKKCFIYDFPILSKANLLVY